MYRQIISQRDRLGQAVAAAGAGQGQGQGQATTEAEAQADVYKMRNKRSQTFHIQTTSAAAVAQGVEEKTRQQSKGARGEQNVWHA